MRTKKELIQDLRDAIKHLNSICCSPEAALLCVQSAEQALRHIVVTGKWPENNLEDSHETDMDL